MQASSIHAVTTDPAPRHAGCSGSRCYVAANNAINYDRQPGRGPTHGIAGIHSRDHAPTGLRRPALRHLTPGVLFAPAVLVEAGVATGSGWAGERPNRRPRAAVCQPHEPP